MFEILENTCKEEDDKRGVFGWQLSSSRALSDGFGSCCLLAVGLRWAITPGRGEKGSSSAAIAKSTRITPVLRWGDVGKLSSLYVGEPSCRDEHLLHHRLAVDCVFPSAKKIP